jgi:hypothetical protein
VSETKFEPIEGRLVVAGDLSVNGESLSGVAIEIPPDKLKGVALALYKGVTILPPGHFAKLDEEYSAVKDALGK